MNFTPEQIEQQLRQICIVHAIEVAKNNGQPHSTLKIVQSADMIHSFIKGEFPENGIDEVE
jgi:hypothetical protein